MNGCVYPLLLRGAVSPACDAVGFSFGSARGSGAEQLQLFGASSGSCGPVARTILIARMVSHPEQDIRAQHLALSDEAFAQGDLGRRLKASTGQVWRIVATNAYLGSKGDTAHRRWAKFGDHSISSGQQAKSDLACVLRKRRIFDGQGTMKKQAGAPQPRRGSAQRPVAGACRWQVYSVPPTGRKSRRKRPPTEQPRTTFRRSASLLAGHVLQIPPATGPRLLEWRRLASAHRTRRPY